MSQEKAANKESGKFPIEPRTKILLGVLVVVLLITVYLQFFSGDDPKPASPQAVNTGVAATPRPSPSPRVLNPNEKPLPIITQPLEFAWFGNRASGDGTGRNIFMYPTPTPPPTPRPQPPPPPQPTPPIMLSSVNPPGVIGRTGAFMMTIMGDKIPVDAQAFLDGRPYSTRFVSQNKIEVQVPAEAIRTGGNLGIQVRSKSEVALYSNSLLLNVAEPPPPNYKYVGLLSNRSGATAVLKSQADETEVHSVVKGGKFGTHWRVISISPQRIEVEDTNFPPPIKIIHVINYTAENN